MRSTQSGKTSPKYASLSDSEQTPVPESCNASPIERRIAIRVGDTAQVEQFYHQRFKDLQQQACRSLGKIWVALLQPKKQSKNPYSGGDSSKPFWWPDMCDGKPMPHKEPDHLLKHQRIALFVHILKVVMDRDHRMRLQEYQDDVPDIASFKTASLDGLASFFKDKSKNGAKKEHLQEIFRVASMQERYLQGRVDGSYQIYVRNCGAGGIESPLGDEESEEETSKPDLDDEQDDESMSQPIEYAISSASTSFSDAGSIPSASLSTAKGTSTQNGYIAQPSQPRYLFNNPPFPSRSNPYEPHMGFSLPHEQSQHDQIISNRVYESQDYISSPLDQHFPNWSMVAPSSATPSFYTHSPHNTSLTGNFQMPALGTGQVAPLLSTVHGLPSVSHMVASSHAPYDCAGHVPQLGHDYSGHFVESDFVDHNMSMKAHTTRHVLH